jgi:hypothetical protein
MTFTPGLHRMGRLDGRNGVRGCGRLPEIGFQKRSGKQGYYFRLILYVILPKFD